MYLLFKGICVICNTNPRYCRYHMFEKAFRLAIDLNDHDLFMDIHFYALVVNDTAMATAAKENAERILSRSNSCSSSRKSK